ncbi:MAG: hypothetical protein J6Q51_01080 [Clostridia bacterium]|nr:hypothetical protein [Clostridia bacterium]
MLLNLTYDETQKLDETGAVYALRESGCYLVEKERFSNKYSVTIFGSKVEVIKSYQKELGN